MISERHKNHVEQLQKFAEQSQKIAESKPDDIFAAIIAENQKQAAEEEARKYALEKRESQGAIVELRFLGAQAENGSLPLDYFLKIFNPLSTAIKRVAYNLLTDKVRKNIPNEIKDALNIRLADIRTGSTRILLSGSIEKDCTNQSLFSDSMTEIFDLLNAEHDEIHDRVKKIGETSAKYLSDALKATKSLDLTLEMTWSQPNKNNQWKGTVGNLDKIISLLADFVMEKEYEEIIEGTIYSISKQAIKVKQQDGSFILVKYHPKLLSFVQTLSVLTDTRLKVRTKKLFNEATQEYAYNYKLLDPNNI